MELITTKEAALLLGITPGTLFTWRQKFPERISWYTYGKGTRPAVRYDKADVLAYIERCKSTDGAA